MRRMRNPNELFVGDLSFFCREHHLVELFSSCGPVVDARIKRSEAKGKTLMYGFVRMDTLKGALTAAKELNGVVFMGRTMKVQLSLTNTYHDHTQVALQGFQVHSSFTSFFPIDGIVEPDEGKLRRLYEPYGEIYDVVVKEYIVHHKEQRQEGYGFITFASEEQAHNAATQCSCVIIDGIRVESTISHRSRTHDPAIPGYPLNNSYSLQHSQQSFTPPPRLANYESVHTSAADYRSSTKLDPYAYPANIVPTNHNAILQSSYMSPQQPSQVPQLPLSMAPSLPVPIRPSGPMPAPTTNSGTSASGGLTSSAAPTGLNVPTNPHFSQSIQTQQFNKLLPSLVPSMSTQPLPIPPPPAAVHNSNIHHPTNTHSVSLSVSHHGHSLSGPAVSQSGSNSHNSSMYFHSSVPVGMFPVHPTYSMPPSLNAQQHASDMSMDGSRLYMSSLNLPAQQQFGHDASLVRGASLNAGLFVNGDRWSQGYQQGSYSTPHSISSLGFHNGL